MLRQIRLLIFDLDYVILDCAALKIRALRQTLISYSDSLRHDIRLPDLVDIEAAYRDHGSLWIRNLEIGFSDDQLLDLEADYLVQESRFLEAGMGKPYIGISELLAECKREGLSLALGADGSRDYLVTASDRHGLDRTFESAFCTEDFGVGSVDEMITEIMSHEEVNPSETLLLATRPRYFEAGMNLDVMTLGCGWGIEEHSVLAQADFQSLTIDHALTLIRQADEVSAGEST